MHKRKELIQGRYMGIKTNKKGTTIYFKYFRFEAFSILQSIYNNQHFNTWTRNDRKLQMAKTTPINSSKKQGHF